MLLVSVFVLSALVGGGVAGMFLALGERQDGAVIPGIGANVTDAAIEATVAALGKAMDSAADAEPDSGATRAAVSPAPETAEQKAVQKAAASPAVGDETATVPAASADVEQLKALTDQVVATLGGLNAPQPEELEGGDLRARLARLVSTALAQGKTDEEIRLLVEEALAGAEEGRIQGLVRDASGKIDIRHLIAAILPNEQVVSANLDGKTRAYFRQLAQEARHTVTGEEPRRIAGLDVSGLAPAGPVATAGTGKNGALAAGVQERTSASRSRAAAANRRLIVRNGRRYVIVRKGDTLRSIAQAVYGSERAYAAILRANRGRVRGGALKPGMRLLVPEIKVANHQKRRNARRRGSGRRQVLQASRARSAGNRVIPTAARPASYRTSGARSTRVNNSRRRK